MSETEFLETLVEPTGIEQAETVITERKPIMSGHCRFPQTADPQQSHDRCARNGAGTRSNPAKVWHPCSCGCHLGDEYECGNCGRLIAEAPLWDGSNGAWVGDEEPEMVYVHIDTDGTAIGEGCP